MKMLNEINGSLNDILTTSIKVMPVAGGNVMRGMRETDVGFVGFGEAYFSYIKPKKIKAWKKHSKMTLNLIVPHGNVMFVFMDDKSQFRKETIGDTKKIRLSVPPGLWFGLQGLKAPYSLLMNVADIPHEPSEVERRNIDEVNFDWRSSK